MLSRMLVPGLAIESSTLGHQNLKRETDAHAAAAYRAGQCFIEISSTSGYHEYSTSINFVRRPLCLAPALSAVVAALGISGGRGSRSSDGNCGGQDDDRNDGGEVVVVMVLRMTTMLRKPVTMMLVMLLVTRGVMMIIIMTTMLMLILVMLMMMMLLIMMMVKMMAMAIRMVIMNVKMVVTRMPVADMSVGQDGLRWNDNDTDNRDQADGGGDDTGGGALMTRVKHDS